MSEKSGVRFPVWVSQVTAICEADIRKLLHDPLELFIRMVQPLIWLLIFGQAMNAARVIPTGTFSYLDYIAPGILAQSILFVAIFYGIALILERDMGILHKILVTPAPRFALVLGRAIGAGIRSLSQVVVVYVVCYCMDIHVRLDFFSLLGVLLVALLAASIFSTFSLIVAAVVKKRERFMGIGQLLTMPLFFASNALYPIEIMPHWIRMAAIFNPLTYLVDALRAFMIVGETSQFGLLYDFGIGVGVFVLLLAVATRLYPKIIY